VSIDAGMCRPKLNGGTKKPYPHMAPKGLSVTLRGRLGVGGGVGILSGVCIVKWGGNGDGGGYEYLFAMIFGAASTGAGLVIGTVIGLIRGSEGWEEVPLPPVQPFMEALPDGRLGLGFSIPARR
jgi:hypothetical protein